MSYQDTGPSGGGGGMFDWGNILGGALGGLFGIFQNERNIAFQRQANQQNIDFMRETNEQNESLMRESWAREDTAVQRRAADLRATGMNPVLAAGAGAQAGSPIQLKAPQVEAPQQGTNPMVTALVMANAAQDLEAKKAAIAQTRAQTKVTEKQQEGLDLDNKLKSGTLSPKVQEAETAARVAMGTAAQKIAAAQLSNDELAERIRKVKAEADISTEASKWEQSRQHRASVGDWQVIQSRELDMGLKKIATQVADQYSLRQAEQELLLTQARAIATKAVGSQGAMDAEFYKKIGISPALGDRIFQLINVLIQGIKAF